ncbi:MAG: hypothetical protein OHK0046_24890 [Anaerolineae bacterium]
MSIKVIYCPACSAPLPPETLPNQLVACPSCGATLYLSENEIGHFKDGIPVATPTRVYTVLDLLSRDDVCSVYRCRYTAQDRQWQGMFRLSRDSDDNDLVKTEAQTLFHLQGSSQYDDFSPFLPTVLESFVYHDSSLQGGRQVNIFGLHEGIRGPNELYSLEEVKQHYPNGIDPRDMAWMWRRLLYVLGFIHNAGVVHGGVIPAHVLIEVKDRKHVLTGWVFSVRRPDPMRAISVSHEDWYPQEVFNKKPSSPALDLAMGARCMMYLIGADPLDDAPEHRNLEPEMARYFGRCIQHKPQDAWALLAEFDKIMDKVWGERVFRVFPMPYKP